MKKTVFTLLLGLGTIIFFAGCKKDDPGTTQPKCKITSIVAGSNSATVTYNTDGTIASVTFGSVVTTYSYNGNVITETITSSGQTLGKLTVTVNSAGLATNVKTEIQGGEWDNEAHEYNGNQISRSTYTSSDGGDAEITTYQWSGGNMVSINDDGDITTIDYYTDKPTQQGDYLFILQLLQGYTIFKSNNMVKSATDGTDVTNITYTFDSDGKVTSFTEDDGSDQTAYGLSYQCN